MKTRAIIPLLTIVLFLSCQKGFTQHSDHQFIKEYLPIWKSAVKLTLELAEAMPDSLYQYTPSPEMRTFAGQMVHIAHSTQWMYEYLIQKKTSGLVESPDADSMKKEEVLQYLNEMLTMATENLKNYPPEKLDDKVNYFDQGEMTVRWAFLFLQDHMVNHRAKANLYFRLNGLTPPEYRYLTEP